MKKNILFSLCFMTAIAAFSQNFIEVSYDAGYTKQTFLELETGNQVSLDNTSWDIAFSTAPRGSGILVNEATGSEGAELELYKASTNDFADEINVEDLTNRLYNNEESWETGAFNSIASPDNPFSLGWGEYNPQNHSINASAVYVLKLRDGAYKKLQIVSLIGGVYTFKHADLNGENEITLTIDKADFEGENTAFYSLTNSAAIEEVPTKWDLLFTRYITPLDDGEGGIVDYLLTGTLTNAGVEVAQLDGIDPKTVQYAEAEDKMETRLDVIGYDWKDFDFATFSWAIPTDRVYFVKTANDKIYKLQFIDFEGSSTGKAVFEQTEVSATTAVLEVDSHLESLSVFPNPTEGEINIAYSMKQRGDVNFSLKNILGQTIWTNQLNISAGFHAYQLPDLGVTAGNYLLQIQIDEEIITEKLVIK